MFICVLSQKGLTVTYVMPIGLPSGKILGIITKSTLVNIFLLSNALVWYAYAIDILQQSVSALKLDFLPNMLVWSIHFAALIASALVGVSLTKRLGGRIRFLAIWMILGTIASLAPIVVNVGEAWGVVTLCLVFGLSLGFGMPNCMGYYTSQVAVEKRGRIGGFIILFTGLGTVGLSLIAVDSIVLQAGILTLWRALSLILLAFIKPTSESEQKGKAPSYRNVLNQRPFVLYFVPWIMFSLLNYLGTPVQQNILSPSMVYDLQLIGNAFLGVSAFIGGFFMDFVGRKRMAIIGFVILGLSCSVLGFFQETPIWYFHTALNGISWGILYVLFVVTIWGDLSHGAPSDKYYALGVAPFFVSKFLELTINAQIVAVVNVSAIFSFLALFLFLAVLPLIYAPETLSEKVIKDIELESYLEKAKKIKEKYA